MVGGGGGGGDGGGGGIFTTEIFDQLREFLTRGLPSNHESIPKVTEIGIRI